MSLKSMSENRMRPTIVIGESGSGKTLKARTLLENKEHIKLFQANDINIDIHSLPNTYGIIVEDLHIKPDKTAILNLLNFRRDVVLTSLNEKDIPKPIINQCKRLRLGRKDARQEAIKEIAPNAEKIRRLDCSIFDMTMNHLKNPNRKDVIKIYKHNKPPDIQILSWIEANVHPKSIAFVDSIMRRWNKDYFYELLALSHKGNYRGKPSFPKRGNYSPIPKICMKLGLKENESKFLKQFLKDKKYEEWAAKELTREECKIIKIEKPRRKTVRVNKIKTLEDFN